MRLSVCAFCIRVEALYTLKHHPAESVTSDFFIADPIYAQAAKCGYTDQARKEQDILDRLVVGIRDTQLSRRMQLDSALTLDKAKKHVLQTEAVQETHKKLVTPSAGNSRDNPVEVDAVTGGDQGDDHSDQLISDNANARHLGIQTATGSRRRADARGARKKHTAGDLSG